MNYTINTSTFTPNPLPIEVGVKYKQEAKSKYRVEIANEIIYVSEHKSLKENCSIFMAKNPEIINNTNTIESFVDLILVPYLKSQTEDYKVSQKQKTIISDIKEKAESLILTRYSTYKQLNYIREGGATLDIMSTYIDNVRTQSNTFEAEVLTLDTLKSLEDYNFEYIIE